MTSRISLVFMLAVCFWTVPAVAQPVTQPFSFSIVSHNLPFLYKGDIKWADLDGDGDLDAVVTGSSDGLLISDIYRNDTVEDDVTFSKLTTGLPGLIFSFISTADFDGDGDIDILLSGSSWAEHPYAPVTRLYRNDAGAWVSVEGTGFPAVHSGSSDWGDLDNDGDLDLLLTGVLADDSYTSIIAENLGNGTFSILDDVLPAVGYGDADLGDYDGDGDLDIAISGSTADGFITRVYRNSDFTFFQVNDNMLFEPVAFSSVSWGDIDNDQDLDLAVSGGQASSTILTGKTNIYRNNGAVGFSPLASPLADILSGEITWGDYDVDGTLDIMMIGAQDVFGRRTGRIYKADGTGEFEHLTSLPGTMFGSAQWGDFDGDGDIDLISTGNTTSGQIITNIYRNERQVVPPIPGAPRIASAVEDHGAITLQWEEPDDMTGANASVTYNLRVGTQPGGSDVVTPMADPESGYRWVSGPGNAAAGTIWTIKNLPNGTYYWSVQAMNNAFSPSAFAQEGTFEIVDGYSVATEDDPELPRTFAVHPNYPNPFSSSTSIQYDLPQPATVQIRIYSILGREVALLLSSPTEAGRHTLTWDGRDASGSPAGSGVYFYEMRADGRLYSGKMTLVR